MLRTSLEPVRSLYDAIQKGDRPAVECLIAGGIDLNQQYHNTTALIVTAGAGRKDIVELLVSRDIDAKGTQGGSALRAAAAKNHIDILEILIAHGANMNATDATGWTALHEAAREGRTRVVQCLVSHGAQTESKNNGGATPIDLAANRGFTDIVRLLAPEPSRVTLHTAACMGDVQRIAALLDGGEDVRGKNANGETPLYVAARAGQRAAATLLIDRGADVNHAGPYGESAIIVAARHGRKGIVELLLNHGADIHATGIDHMTPLHYASSGGLDFKEPVRLSSDKEPPEDSGKASRDSFVETARLLIARGADVNARTPGRVTPLHVAARTGNRDIAEALIDAGAYINERRRVPPAEKGVGTPLHWAASGGRIQVAELLIARGADVNAATEADAVYKDYPTSGPTPLHTAVYQGRGDMVKLLITRGADLNPTRLDGFTPLHLAVFYEDRDIVKCLLDHGAKTDVRDREGRTPADIAVMKGHSEVAKMLAAGKSPHSIHLAACAGDRDAITAILKSGVEVNSRNGQGNTPLLAAVKANQREAAAMLIAAGAEVNLKDGRGASALHLAAAEGCAEIMQLLIEKSTTLDIPYGDNKPSSVFLHSGTADGEPVYETPLFVAVGNRREEVAKRLLEAGANPNVKGRSGITPLHYAAWWGYDELVELLLTHGADANARDRVGGTPLHCALHSGCVLQHDVIGAADLDSVELLLAWGADVNARNDEGVAPLQALRARAQRGTAERAKQLIELLRQRGPSAP